ncbi:MAG: FMN-binding protein [Planctomycetaceae bacterium]
MPLLPVIESPAPHSLRWKPTAAVVLRIGLLLVIATAVRFTSTRQLAERHGSAPQIKLSDVQSLVPEASQLQPSEAGQQAILDVQGNRVGFAITTLPAANRVKGYRGPSNVLLILNELSVVTAARLISSDDTVEHVEAIRNDRAFLSQFHGWTAGDTGSVNHIDATTGATLTSLAIAEGIAVRLGSEKPSLKFPDDLQQPDLQLVFKTTQALNLQPVSPIEATVVNSQNVVVGRVIRTGPLVDSIAGYQGPSEVVIAVDTAGKVTQLALRRTFDNQPYAGYLNDEPYFWKAFQKQSLEQLQHMDLEAAQVEGVSGATMTSMAVAETIVAAAGAYHEQQLRQQADRERRTLYWGVHDTGTVLILCGGMCVGLTRWRGRRRVRTVWNLILVIYFGLVTGNLISLAVIMGWAAGGIAWRLAPGLALVVLISLLLPPLTRRNLYCTHLCPHGAAQQLLKNRLRTTAQINPRWARRLTWLPGLILLLGVLATLFGRTWNLAAWEPFDAWIWYVAGTSSLILAVASLTLAAVIPMAWCRYGCATGRLLEYIRRTARSDQLTAADLAVAVLAAVSIWHSTGGQLPVP